MSDVQSYSKASLNSSMHLFLQQLIAHGQHATASGKMASSGINREIWEFPGFIAIFVQSMDTKYSHI